jgi:hypothetical protein
MQVFYSGTSRGVYFPSGTLERKETSVFSAKRKILFKTTDDSQPPRFEQKKLRRVLEPWRCFFRR